MSERLAPTTTPDTKFFWDALKEGKLLIVLPRHPRWPWFDETYVVALVQLEEGVRIVSNLNDVDPAEVTIGMPVEAYVEHFDNVSLPQFRPRRTR
jgi:hypothetical protein